MYYTETDEGRYSCSRTACSSYVSEKNGYHCYPQGCPDEYPYLDGSECKKTCQSGQYTLNPGNSTKLICQSSWSYYYEWNATSKLKRCVRQCDKDEYFVETDRLCGPSCKSKLYNVQNKTRVCIDSCSSYRVNYSIASDNNTNYTHCTDKCPDEQSYYLPNKTCVVSCPPDYNYIYSKQCRNNCSNSGYYRDDKDKDGYYTCTSSCYPYVVEAQGNHCMDKCPGDKPYLDGQ